MNLLMKNMSRPSIVLIVLCTVVGNLQAANWLHVTNSADDDPIQRTWEIDGDSLRYKDGYLQAWVRSSVEPPQILRNARWSSLVGINVFHCDRREIAWGSTTYFSQPVGRGTVIASSQVTADEASKQLRDVLPGSFGEAMLDFACKLQATKIAEERHDAAIARIHPNWRMIVTSQEFLTWALSLPIENRVEIVRIREAGTAEEVIELLNRFKRTLGAK